MKKRRYKSVRSDDNHLIMDEEGNVTNWVDPESGLFNSRFTYVSRINLLYACAELTHRELRLFMFMHCVVGKNRLIFWTPSVFNSFTSIDKSCLSSLKSSLVKKGFISKISKQTYLVTDMKKTMPGAKALALAMTKSLVPS
jgi:hypothetical protein